MAALNRDFRGLDQTTDVLAFAMGEGEGAQLHPHLLGDVVVSTDQAARQSPDGNLEAEVARLLAHGLCHLLGHDHQRAPQAQRMRSEERRLLAPLGLSPAYE